MDTNMGDDITLNYILQRNFKRQSWDPWLPNSYLCADEQPIQPLAHDPNAQESMSQIMQMKQYIKQTSNPEDIFLSSMNNAKANQDATRYQSMFKKWQDNYSMPSTSRVWYVASDPNNYQQELIYSTLMNQYGQSGTIPATSTTTTTTTPVPNYPDISNQTSIEDYSDHWSGKNYEDRFGNMYYDSARNVYRGKDWGENAMDPTAYLDVNGDDAFTRMYNRDPEKMKEEWKTKEQQKAFVDYSEVEKAKKLIDDLLNDENDLEEKEKLAEQEEAEAEDETEKAKKKKQKEEYRAQREKKKKKREEQQTEAAKKEASFNKKRKGEQ